MIGIGKPAPDFTLEGAHKGRSKHYTLSSYPGEWLILFFYPADFTFICPTEILGFEKKHQDFRANRAGILGVSVDPIETHMRWAEELKGLSYPLLSDVRGDVSRSYGVFDETENVAQRATFVINPDRLVLYVSVVSANVGRSVEETLRVLRALQSGKLCPADWKPGDDTGELSLRY